MKKFNGLRKAVVLAVATVALLCAGYATAAGNLKIIRLHAGQSVRVGTVKVIDVTKPRTIAGQTITVTEPAKTVTNVQTVTAPTQTQTVTNTVTNTQVVTVTVAAPAPPPPTCSGPVVKDFSGNGDQLMAPFTTCQGETLTWTYQNTNGDFPTGMFISDTSSIPVNSDGNTTSGSTFFGTGTHNLHVVTIGNWTIHVG